MISRTYIEDNPFYPTIFNVAGWNTLFVNGVPKMNAYIGTTAKQGATVIAESEKEDPVLAEWQYGLGKTFAFTADSTGKWTGTGQDGKIGALLANAYFKNATKL